MMQEIHYITPLSLFPSVTGQYKSTIPYAVFLWSLGTYTVAMMRGAIPTFSHLTNSRIMPPISRFCMQFARSLPGHGLA